VDVESDHRKRDWPTRQSREPRKKNVQRLLVAEVTSILLLPLHIKLGKMKDLVKAMDQRGPAFWYLVEEFPGIGVPKMKEGRFCRSTYLQALQRQAA
jgi:hypothetical protein